VPAIASGYPNDIDVDSESDKKPTAKNNKDESEQSDSNEDENEEQDDADDLEEEQAEQFQNMIISFLDSISTESSEEEESLRPSTIQFLDSSSISTKSSPEEEEELYKPDPFNLIIEQNALTDSIEKNCRCLVCYGPVVVSYWTVTLATGNNNNYPVL
jgi:hypothetical protein